MFVVRSDRQRDDPVIQFITDDKEIAEALVGESQQKRYREHIKSNTWHVEYQQERLDFLDYQRSKGKVFDEYDEEEYTRTKESIEYYTPLTQTTFEEWLADSRNRWSDWYYEEVPVIQNLETALAIFKEKEGPWPDAA